MGRAGPMKEVDMPLRYSREAFDARAIYGRALRLTERAVVLALRVGDWAALARLLARRARQMQREQREEPRHILGLNRLPE